MRGAPVRGDPVWASGFGHRVGVAYPMLGWFVNIGGGGMKSSNFSLDRQKIQKFFSGWLKNSKIFLKNFSLVGQ
jgi:hypothetical protein